MSVGGLLLLAACTGSGGPSIEDQAATIVAATAAAASPTPTPLAATLTRTATPSPMPTETPSPTPTPLAGGGWITFSSSQFGQSDLFLIRPDGTDLTRLTRSPEDERYPAWSPDGQQLVFESWSVRRDTEMHLLPIHEGSEVVLLEAISGVSSWSVRGEILISAGRCYLNCVQPPPQCGSLNIGTEAHTACLNEHPPKNTSDLFLIGSNLADFRALTTSPQGFEYPRWSPDGERILFVHCAAAFCEEGFITIMNKDASAALRLGQGAYPAWSPDGSRIAYTWNSDLYVRDADGSDPTLVLEGEKKIISPTWSPDGEWIAFGMHKDGIWTIYIVPAACRLQDEPCKDLMRVLVTDLKGLPYLYSLSLAWSPVPQP